jgi:hypothetical protein
LGVHDLGGTVQRTPRRAEGITQRKRLLHRRARRPQHPLGHGIRTWRILRHRSGASPPAWAACRCCGTPRGNSTTPALPRMALARRSRQRAGASTSCT